MENVYYCIGNKDRNEELMDLIKTVCPNVKFNGYSLSSDNNLYYIVDGEVFGIDLTDPNHPIVRLIKKVGTEIKLPNKRKLVPVTKYVRIYRDDIGEYISNQLYDTLEEALDDLSECESDVVIGYKPETIYVFVDE